MTKPKKLPPDSLRIETRDYVTTYTIRVDDVDVGPYTVRVVDARPRGESVVLAEYLSVNSAGDPAWRPCKDESPGTPHLARDSVLSELLRRLTNKLFAVVCALDPDACLIMPAEGEWRVRSRILGLGRGNLGLLPINAQGVTPADAVEDWWEKAKMFEAFRYLGDYYRLDGMEWVRR